MIDFHTHILPGIDDGAVDIREAIALIEALQAEEVISAVCTPHFDPSDRSLQDFVMLRDEAINVLRELVTIELISASESTLHAYLLNYFDLSALCIGNTRYLLIELPFHNSWENEVYKILDSLILYHNIIPIIAHIERYPAVSHGSACIKRLKDIGCVLQLNTSSLLDNKLKKRAVKYIRKGYIDILGSDCHNMTNRPPVITEGLRVIEEKFGIKYCRRFEDNAVKILADKDIRE
jgi:protein-tyrosine phosphatase